MISLKGLTQEELNRLAVAVDHQLTVGAGEDTPDVKISIFSFLGQKNKHWWVENRKKRVNFHDEMPIDPDPLYFL